MRKRPKSWAAWFPIRCKSNHITLRGNVIHNTPASSYAVYAVGGTVARVTD